MKISGVVLAHLAHSSCGVRVTPLEKIVGMLSEMKTKGVAEMKDEEVTFSTFKQWCANTARTKTEAIDEATKQMEELNAEIDKATADIEDYEERISELDEDIARFKKDQEAATDVRNKEKADYDATKGEYDETLAACEAALNVLRKLPDAVAQGFLQTDVVQSIDKVAKAPKTPSSTRNSLLAFVQQNPQGLAVQNKQAHAYESQTPEVEEMIDELRQRFREERHSLEKEEIGARSNYETIMATLNDNIKMAEQEAEQKSKRKAGRAGDKAEAQGDLDETSRVKDSDMTYRADTEAMCKMKQADFDNRQKLRGEELEALDKAMEIIRTLKEPTDVARGASAFVQLRSNRKDKGSNIQKTLDLLHARATSSGSKVLSLAYDKARMAAKSEGDVDTSFKKVKILIRNLITKLMEEAVADTEHHGWCQAEVATNKLTRQHKYEEVDGLMTETEELNALITRLAQEIEELTTGINELTKAMADADVARSEESAKNAKVAKEAGEAAEATAQALAVLRDFYAKAAEATALAQMQQTPADDAPETFDKSFQGQQGQAGNVVNMLEVLESDFARLESDTESAEGAARANHKRFVDESTTDIALKNTEKDHKTNKKEEKELLLQTTKSTLDKTQAELDKALAYYDKLKPTCLGQISYEERVKRRQEEIDSLSESYEVLAGEPVPSFQDMKAEQLEGESTRGR